MRRSLIGAATVVAVVLAATSPARADKIFYRDGRVEDNVTVVDETYKEVVFQYQAANVKTNVPATNVIRVEHDSQPASLRRALDSMERFAYDDAIENFKTSIRSTQRKWVKQYSLNYMGQCYLAMRDTKAATGAFNELLREFPETRFLADAKVGIARAKLIDGDTSGADAAFKTAINEIQSKGIGDYWALKVELESIGVAVANGKWADAKGRYKAVADRARSGNFSDLHIQAVVGEATARVETGDTSGAQSMLSQIIETGGGSDDRTMAVAYTLLGQCHEKANQTEDALMAFLRVVVLYSHVGSQAPRAYYGAATAFEKLGGDENAQRAEQLKRELKQRYPSSPWAQK